jgi:hypothetical protein
VSQGERGLERNLAAQDVQVGVADPGNTNAHHYLAGAGRGPGQLDQLDRLAGADKTNRFHSVHPNTSQG